jgi:superfamily I DNA/RNA helicase
MAWDDGLTGVARQIAATDNSPLRVMAGPGTGKSFAMKRRVARYLEAGQDATRILAVTFTRNAAAALVDDLHALGIQGCENIRAGTLHSFCFALLAQQDVFDYLGRVVRPIMTFMKSGVMQFEGNVMLEDIRTAQFGAKRDCTKRVRAFEAAWARLQSDIPGWPTDATDRAFQAALLDWLKFHQAMLIGELVPEALRFLRNNPTCEARTAYDHVIVDEYQDLNRAEQDLIRLLASNSSNAIVGDVDQSIYSFRHANPEGIETFHTANAGTHDEVLDECRRCPTRVVALADHLISHNHPVAAGPRLRPRAANNPGEVNIVQWSSVRAEAEGLAEYVQHLTNNGIQPGEILILTPRRLLGYGIRDQIETRGIAVHSFYHEEALEEEAAQRAFTILSLLVNPEDRVSLRWWLGEGSPSYRRNAYLRLKQHCEASGLSPKAVLDACIAGTLNLNGVGDLIIKYDELTAILAGLQTKSVAELIDALFPAGNDDVAVIREAALLDLDELETGGDLLDLIKTNVSQPTIPEEVDYVRVMSLHKSKGLTSKVTIVAGCTHGLIPFVDQRHTAQEAALSLKEQRRLFYVAITRCTETLVISSVSRMTRKFAWKIGARIAPGSSASAATIASQFIDELGPSAPAPKSGADWVASGFA